MIPKTRMLGLLLVASASLMVGCTTSPANPSPQPNIQSQQSEVQRHLKNQTKIGKPLRIVLVQDYSPSIKEEGVPNLRSTHIETVLKYMRDNNGGELAIGTICSQSNTPLVRVNIVPKPRLYKGMFLNFPTPEFYRKSLKQEGVNSFEIRRKVSAYRPKYKIATERDFRVLGQHLQRLNDWQQQTQKNIQTFRKQYKPLLQQGFTCAETDVIGGVKRADIFLSETPKNQDRKVAIFVTDGVHTTGGNTKLQWQSHAQVLLVGGAGNPGVFSSITHERYEAVESAVRESLLSTTGGQ